MRYRPSKVVRYHSDVSPDKKLGPTDILVDLPECDALGRRAGGMKRNAARDQAQFEIAFPIGTHGA
jgi:hypothetical protein